MIGAVSRSRGTAVTVLGIACVVIVIVTTAVGVTVGSWKVDHTHPTKADVRSAAHSFVPPGFTVGSETLNSSAGQTVGWFGPPIYSVALDVDGGATFDDRLAAFRQQALGAGWQAQKEDPENPEYLVFDREGMYGGVVVGRDTPSSKASVSRSSEPSIWPVVLFAGAGALLGAGICLVVTVSFGRRRR